MFRPSQTLEQELKRGNRAWREDNAQEYAQILLLDGRAGFTPPRRRELGIVDVLGEGLDHLRRWQHARAAVRKSNCHGEAPGARRHRSVRLSRTGMVMAIPTALICALAYPALAPSSWSAPYFDQHRRTEAIGLEDAGSNWLGVVDRSLTTWIRDAGATTQPVPYVSLGAPAPDDFINVLFALEDRHIGSWQSINGIDMVGVARGFVSLITGGAGPGGSSLTAQLVRSMDGINPRPQTLSVKLKRKMHEFTIGPLLYYKLGGAESPRFREYLARHFPLVIGARNSAMGTPLHGVELSARVIFDKASSKLSRAENAVFAAAVNAPIILAPTDDPDGVLRRDARWKRIQDRAVRGLTLAYSDEPRLAADIDEVRRMAVPSGLVAPEGGRRPADSANKFKFWVNPEIRALALAKGELRAAVGQLADKLDGAALQKVTGVRLTVDARENRRFHIQLRNDLKLAEDKFGDVLSGPLLGEKGNADVIAALVREGKVVRFFANMQEPAFFGGWSERDASNRYDPAKALRPIGSIGKVILVPLLGESDTVRTRYCNAQHGRVQNAGGDRGGVCGKNAAWPNAQLVFAQSLNLPLLWRFRETPDAKLRALAQRYGLNVTPGGSAAETIVLGAATARPADLMRMIDAVGRGADGKPALGDLPTIIAAYRLSGSDWVNWSSDRDPLDLSDAFAKPGVAVFTRGVLSAPVGPGGTLAGIASALGPVSGHIGKSGTSQAGDPKRDRGKFALGGFDRGSSRYTYFLMVDGRNPQQGLASELSWPPLYPSLRTIVAPTLPPANRPGDRRTGS